MNEQIRNEALTELEKTSTQELAEELLKRLSGISSPEALIAVQAIKKYIAASSEPASPPITQPDIKITQDTEIPQSEERKELTVDDRAEITAQLIKSKGIAFINGKFPPAGIRLDDGTQLLEPYPPQLNRIQWQKIGNIGNSADQNILAGLEPYFSIEDDFQVVPANTEVFTTMRITPEGWQRYALQREERDHQYLGQSQRARELFGQEIRYIYYFFRSEVDYDGRGSIPKQFVFVVPNASYQEMFEGQNAAEKVNSDMQQQFLRKVLERTFPGFQRQVPIKDADSLLLIENPRKFPSTRSGAGDFYAWRNHLSNAYKWVYSK